MRRHRSPTPRPAPPRPPPSPTRRRGGGSRRPCSASCSSPSGATSRSWRRRAWPRAARRCRCSSAPPRRWSPSPPSASSPGGRCCECCPSARLRRVAAGIFAVLAVVALVAVDPRMTAQGYSPGMADPRLEGTAIADRCVDLIGNTPLVRLKRISEVERIPSVLAMKMETTNPGGSSKDRPALEMILAAERDGLLPPGRHDRRADQRQHRRRPGHRRRPARLPLRVRDDRQGRPGEDLAARRPTAPRSSSARSPSRPRTRRATTPSPSG